MANDDETTNRPHEQDSDTNVSPPSAASTSSPHNPADQNTTQTAWNSSGPSDTAAEPEDRTQLIARARSFLTSPQVRLEDTSAKHKFLSEKGLSAGEIDELLRELVR